MLNSLRQFFGAKEDKELIAHFSAKILEVERRTMLSVCETQGHEFAVVYDPDMAFWAVAMRDERGEWTLCDFIVPDVMKVLCLLPADPHEYAEVQKFIQLD